MATYVVVRRSQSFDDELESVDSDTIYFIYIYNVLNSQHKFWPPLGPKRGPFSNSVITNHELLYGVTCDGSHVSELTPQIL